MRARWLLLVPSLCPVLAAAQTADPAPLPSIALPTELARVLADYELALRKNADGRWLIFSDMDTGNSAVRRPSPPPEG